VSLAQLVAECVASRIEAAARRKRFTQLGGLQLDKDVRAVMAMFVSRAGGSVRTPFARLQQVRAALVTIMTQLLACTHVS
jgi:conserved oligomeric Golgi complex subunit 4